VCERLAAMAGVCRQGYFVSCEGASEKITRPHGGREESRISAIDAGFEPAFGVRQIGGRYAVFRAESC
jgi:hypothetical protein